ncbi:unnamed protein product [Soboliphyme baturini]|uniref:Uncharacterized protein n=1 Tax=Soboliphyme baturini TaxID=241478 RepID=A0A3P8CU88_9BILA|nr:unnamed protein product [Soboliphyme baturini]
MYVQVDPSGEVIEFNSGGCPWREHLFELEKELQVKPINYVLFPSYDRKSWMIVCVPARPTGFALRLGLPVAWRGLRDRELSTMTGIDSCVFCHANGFCGSNARKEGALDMVRVALRQPREADSQTTSTGDA